MTKHGEREGAKLGNYHLIRLLGYGGFADVYLGEHLYLKSHAALKVLRTSLDDEDIAQFLAEAQTLARLKHPQIVRVHDFAAEQGTPFLVMDYAPRGTLRQQHPRGSCLSLDAVVTYTKHVATALQYAHNHNMIHRDVKPENMLLGTHREVLLSDFGLALFAPSPEQLSTQEMAGTLPYMAPEQLRGKPCFASDQYALGIVVYEWLCGVHPFEGSHWQLINQHMTALPPPLREKDPSLPEEVEGVVLKALAKDPGQRYVSIQLFAQALERASQTEVGILRNDSEVTGSLNAISPAPPVTHRQIFLVSSQADSSFVARLQADLQKRGVTVWNEHHDGTLDTLDQEDMRRKAIRAVDIVVLVVSSHTRTSRVVKEHLRIAALYQRRLVYVWAEGDDLAELLPEAGEKTALLDVIDAHETRYELALDELVACLQEETGVSSPIGTELAPAFEETEYEPRNPYKGLRAFTEDDATDFFGRETLIGELVEGVKERLRSELPGISPARLLAVIGPSGSGKSSVVMAGLLPRLQQSILPGSKEWVYLSPMVPGVHPLETLALTLAPHLPDRSLKSIREDLEDDSARGLHLLATHLVKGSEKRVVLLIDQFEEAFNLTTSENERARFFDLLLTAITERKGLVLVILTLRADFYDRLMASSELGRLIQQYQLVVWPMEVDELRIAIKGPAALPDVRLTFEGNLVGDLLYEVRGQVGALPLLQFTLDQLFERREDHLITHQAYQEIGGVKGALAKHAEEVYQALPSEKQRLLGRTLFLRLIDPGITEQDTTRRRATLTEFVFADPEQTRLMQETMDVFVKARLLTTNAGEDIETTIEVSHEALIREWPLLGKWLREARDDIQLQHAISEDATSWKRNKQSSDRLYRGTQLKEAQAWAKRNTASRQEQAFLHASAIGRLHTLAILIGVVLLVVASSGIAGWLILFPPQPASNYVTNVQNDGSGSLRWAIANTSSGSTITFAPDLVGKTITLTGGDVHLFRQKLTIRGPATGHITIREMGAVLSLDTIASVTISGLVFQGSKTKPQPLLIENHGTLTLKNCTISSNSGAGGGIYNSGTLTVTDSTISGNTATSLPSGGGIDNDGGTLKITSSTVSGNTASASDYGGGGGIYNSGNLTMTNSTVSSNTASLGGGIMNAGTLTMTNSTVSSNTASASNYGGGGIMNAGNLTMTNSTVSSNTASQGGGIYNTNGYSPDTINVTLAFCTIVNNSASGGDGFDIANIADSRLNAPPPQVHMKASIVGGNDTQHNPIAGVITSDGYNVIQRMSSANFDASTAHATDRSVNDLMGVFGPHPLLQNNGGLTQTYQLIPGASNPAYDDIPSDACTDSTGRRVLTDQRGMPRPGKNKQSCDSGAYEYQA